MFDLERIARITGGVWSGKKSPCSLSGVSTDSRNMVPGALFVPLRGEHFDGHDYLSQAVKNGAAACLSEEVIEGLSVPVVRVANTLTALGDIAAAWRLQLRGPLVAVTGSAGKTTTKEMLASIMGRLGPGLKTAGNFNNLIGLPLTLLRLTEQDQWAVIEMGTSALGEIERLTAIAQPSMGIITNIGPAHLETLHGLDGVSRAKGELFAGLQGGTAIINLDDPRVAGLPVANGVKKLTYGLSAAADVQATDISVDAAAVSFELQFNGQRQPIHLPVPGRHNVHNALAAAAAAIELAVSLPEIAAGLAAFAPAQGRMNLAALPCGGLLLDDSYNSNPMSAQAALDALSELKGQGRRVAVLGDMLELGDISEQMHEQLGASAARTADLLLAVGRYATVLAQGASRAGMAKDRIIVLADAAAASNYINEQRRPGDRILVKGSRGVRLDRVSAALKNTAEQSAAEQKGS